MINNLNITGLNTYTDESEFVIVSPDYGSIFPVGVPILFESTGSDRRATVTWSFGDGKSETGSAVYHTYDSPGTYAVTCASEKNGKEVVLSLSIMLYRYPTVRIVRPESSVVQALSDVVFEAEVTNADTVIWKFSDGTEYSGLTCTKSYGLYQISDTVTVTATNILGSTTVMLEITIERPMYVWEDTGGILHSWHDKNKFIVLRDGIDGFSSSTADIITEQNCSNIGEYLKTRVWRRRDGFGFSLAIIGRNHAEIEENRKELIDMLSNYDGEGRLIINFDDGSSVYIRAEKANGYPRIANGLPPQQLARMQVAELRFTSSDPFFYASEVVEITPTDGIIELTNQSDVSTPCIFEISAETCQNESTGEIITNNGHDSIIGVVVSSGDGSCTAELDGENSLYRFGMNSQFWMLKPGINKIIGVSKIRYRPRWSGR